MSSASDRAYAQIRGMILTGELSPGTHIREEALAELCGVSRTPVRDALRRLEAELFIERNDAQRSFVADWSIDDIEDGFIMRAMLEGMAASRAAQRISAEQLTQLKWLNAKIEQAVTASLPDVQTFLECNRDFHAIILAAAGSLRLSNILSRLIEQPVVWRTAQNYDRENLHRSWREHDELLLAFARRDSSWAESIMAGHIRRAFHAYADAHRGQRQRSDSAAA